MSLHRRALGGLALFLLLSNVARAESPSLSPLRFLPEQAFVLVEVQEPRRLVETVNNLEAIGQLRQFHAVQEYLQSKNYRRFIQLLGHLEKELGAPWPELLDRLAGGGIALGVKYAENDAPAVLVVQSKDEPLMKRFAQFAVQTLEQIAQQDSNDKLEKHDYRGFETYQFGPKLHAAVYGGAMILSNDADALKQALDSTQNGGKSLALVDSVAESRQLLPPHPLARLWLNMKTLHNLPGAKSEVFSLPRNNAFGTVLVGGMLDVAGRSAYATAGLYADNEAISLLARMPSGRQGLAPAMRVHVPPAGEPGSRPLLEPKGVMFSTSFFLDVGKFWEDRTNLFTAEQVKVLEDAEKNSGRALAGAKLGELLAQSGSYHRFVVANQSRSGYTRAPGQDIPAFAFVIEPRDAKAFARSITPLLRGAAFLAGLQSRLKLVEEKHGELEIVGYRFPEDGVFPGDNDNLRFNFSPCFVGTGKHFVFCSTLELARELIDLLQQEEKSASGDHLSKSVVQSRIYPAGGADFLLRVEDVLRAQVILGQAVEPDVAKRDVKQLIDWVRQLGGVQTSSGYHEHDWYYDLRFFLKK